MVVMDFGVMCGMYLKVVKFWFEWMDGWMFYVKFCYLVWFVIINIVV